MNGIMSMSGIKYIDASIEKDFVLRINSPETKKEIDAKILDYIENHMEGYCLSVPGDDTSYPMQVELYFDEKNNHQDLYKMYEFFKDLAERAFAIIDTRCLQDIRCPHDEPEKPCKTYGALTLVGSTAFDRRTLEEWGELMPRNCRLHPLFREILTKGDGVQNVRFLTEDAGEASCRRSACQMISLFESLRDNDMDIECVTLLISVTPEKWSGLSSTRKF